MAIAHYPSLHDGATLYLVKRIKGIHVKVIISKSQPISVGIGGISGGIGGGIAYGGGISGGIGGINCAGIGGMGQPASCYPSTLPSTIPLSSIPLPSYVNIHSPSKLSLNRLNKIILYNFDQTQRSSMFGFTGITSNMSGVYCQSTGNQLSPSDAPVASVKWIVDGCTLTFNNPQNHFVSGMPAIRFN